MKSEYKNFILNVVYQILTYIFPLITIPYVSRVLGVENIGIYSYTFSIVSIFLLFAMLGLNNYGNREIAKVRDNREEISQCFSSIYLLQLSVNIIIFLSYIVYLLYFCKEFFLIAAIQLIYLSSVFFDVNWFYFGMEKFKMTITRNLIIKVTSILLIFLLVKNKQDLWLYTGIIAISTLISQLYLFFKLPCFVDFKFVPLKEITKHIPGVTLLFIPVLAYSIYRVMDKVMIGAFSSVVELGYYENAERLINIPISIVSALGVVMLPRMSYLLANDKTNLKKTILSSMHLVLILSTIMAFGLFLIADEISVVMFGSDFIKSGSIIKAISVTIVISAWANVIRTQYVIPNGLDRIYVTSTIGGAVLNLASNLIFIKLYGALGACIGTVIAELFVMLYQTIVCKRELEIYKYYRLLLKYSLHSFFIVWVAYLLASDVDDVFTKLCVKIGVSILLFFVLERKYIWYSFLGK